MCTIAFLPRRAIGASTAGVECPIAMKWQIQKSSLWNKLDGCLHSTVFTASTLPNIKYSLEIYPNGRNDEERGTVWICLKTDLGHERNIEAKVYVFVGERWETDLCDTCNQSKSLPIKLCTREELFDAEMEYLVFDQLNIKVQGILTAQKRSNTPASLCMGVLSNLLWECDNKDVALVVGDKEFMVHKIVLSTRSEWFNKMFSNPDWKENLDNRIIIKSPNENDNLFSVDIVEAAVRYLYDRPIQSTDLLTFPNAMALLQFADFYCIFDLKNSIEMFLIGNINVSNVCKFANCSIKANALKLKQSCSDFLTTCLRNATPVSDFDELDQEFSIKFLKESFFNVSVKS